MLSQTLGKYLRSGMDDWEESKHHRDDVGRFTSGSGKGKKSDPDDKKEEKGKKPESERKFELTQAAAEGFVRDAFRITGGGLKDLKFSGRTITAKTDIKNPVSAHQKKSALNAVLSKHGLKAEFVGKDYNTYKIAEDSVEDYANDACFRVLVGLCQIEMLSKDLHYKAEGKSFYGVHLLADTVNGIGKFSDDLNEVYFMGEKAMNPPDKATVAAEAVKGLAGFGADGGADENTILGALFIKCSDVIRFVEEAKRQRVASGTAAVLDEISKGCLQAIGLLRRTQKSKGNSDAIGRVIQKGIFIQPSDIAR